MHPANGIAPSARYNRPNHPPRAAGRTTPRPRWSAQGALQLLGYQVCIDLFDCDTAALDMPTAIESAVRALAAGIGASVVEVSTHRFAPQGLSCMARISASHIAIHTWPENGFAAVDVFSCTTRVDVEALAAILRAAFGARQQSCTEVARGVGLPSPYFRDAQV